MRRRRSFATLAALTGLASFASSAVAQPTLIVRGDGSYENAIAWQFEGAEAPDLGAIAVRFPEATESRIEGVVLDLTGAPSATQTLSRNRPNGAVGSSSGVGRPSSAPPTRTSSADGAPAIVDLYLWDDSGGAPGPVVWMNLSAEVPDLGEWPSFVRVEFAVDPPLRCDALIGTAAWAGFWGHWPGVAAEAFLGVDASGLGPAGMTRIAPDLGFPSGWQEISVAWPGVSALGIGILVEPCGPEPVLLSSWGAVKQRYADSPIASPTRRSVP